VWRVGLEVCPAQAGVAGFEESRGQGYNGIFSKVSRIYLKVEINFTLHVRIIYILPDFISECCITI
jgi:hypothetical protein